MRYNVYFKTVSRTFNVLSITKEQLDVIVNAYLTGKETFTISGEKKWIKRLSKIKIFTLDLEMEANDFKRYCISHGQRTKTAYSDYIHPEYLGLYGKDITDEMLANKEFGESAINDKEAKERFINVDRIEELKAVSSPDFDLTKLIRICEEINSNYSCENYLSVGILIRTIVDHIPPIFGFTKFNEVANNYGTKSFKASMQNLNNSLRKIADGYLHTTIRKKEVLPNDTQVNFRPDIDVLLSEIIRKLNEK